MIKRFNFNKGWMPDFLPYAMPEDGLILAQNLLPYDEYYAPTFAARNLSSNAFAEAPNNAFMYKNSAGTRYAFFGTNSKLYRLETNLSLSDYTRGAGAYNTGSNQWKFVPYGNWLIATNFGDAPQVWKPEAVPPDDVRFIALGGNPPKAKYCIFNNGHVIFAYLDEGGVISPQKLKWSALEGIGAGIEDYAPSLATGAGSQNLADADGEITGLVSLGSIIVVFHKNSITVGWYTGAPYTYTFPRANEIKNIGAIPNTIIAVGGEIYFWDKSDIYKFNGNQLSSIGFGVRNTILNLLNTDYLYRITTAHDVKRGLIFWGFPSKSSNGYTDKMLVYNYRSKRFTLMDVALQCIYIVERYASESPVAMDSLDADYPIADEIPYQLDSDRFGIGMPAIGCVRKNNRVGIFTSDVKEGIIETGEISDEEGNIYLLRNIRPKLHAGKTVRISVGSRFNENDNVSYGSEINVGTNGLANVLKSGRFLRVKMWLTDHWGLTGMDLDLVPVGKR